MKICRFSFALMCVVSFVMSSSKSLADERIVVLIDQLQKIDKPDWGYAQYVSGSGFLPYDDTENLDTFVFGATGREKSDVMKQLVEMGFDAVPDLVKHLTDKRKTKLPPIESGGMAWISFANEYDVNRATIKSLPLDFDPKTSGIRMDTAAEQHEVTVGDLCFVALGQIVNRRWSASRYQPSGGRIISSPTHSEELHHAIMDEWGSLDRAEHRRRLIEDFRTPDSIDRMVGAYHRLCLYYPSDVEQLVLEKLSESSRVRRTRKSKEFQVSPRGLVGHLTHDGSLAVGQVVQHALENTRDEDLVFDCLKCLASRPQFGDYLAEKLSQMDFSQPPPPQFRPQYLSAIAKSKSAAVRLQLERISKTTMDPTSFCIASKAITESKEEWESAGNRIREILDKLPSKTKDGKQLLDLVVDKIPDQAESIIVQFLKHNTPSRCNTACEVLWYDNPLSQRVLLPLLDDDRSIPGVRDRAAQAISHSLKTIRYSSDWSKPARDLAIRKIKEYCQGQQLHESDGAEIDQKR